MNITFDYLAELDLVNQMLQAQKFSTCYFFPDDTDHYKMSFYRHIRRPEEITLLCKARMYCTYSFQISQLDIPGKYEGPGATDELKRAWDDTPENENKRIEDYYSWIENGYTHYLVTYAVLKEGERKEP